MGDLRFGFVWRGELSVTEAARRAEDAGYARFLIPDHTGMVAPMPALAAAAAVTEHIDIGTQVVNIAFRPLAALAQEAAALDIISGGRLLLGLGAGYAEDEVRSMGLDFPTARERINEVARALEVLPRLFAGETVTESPGRERLDGFSLHPLPPQGADIPTLVGGNGDRMLGVAARQARVVQFTGFTAPPGSDNFASLTYDGLADRVDYVRRTAGDRFDRLELSVLVQRAYVTDDPAGVAAEFLGDALPLAQALDCPFMLFGSVDAICERILELRERFGITYLTVFDGRHEGFDEVLARLA
jgi:probable F420-dependent oxidoreductase